MISKLFEMVVMSLYEKQLSSDSLQFGFKKRSSCSHALFTVRTNVEHYVKNGCRLPSVSVLWIYPRHSIRSTILGSFSCL